MKDKKKKKTREIKATHHLEHDAEGAASGAVAGAVFGAMAGPPGMVAGAVIGAVAGAVAASALDIDSELRAKHTRELDEAIGVSGGDLGAPNLKHPPATIGAYSAGSTAGGGASDESEPAEGPMQTPET
jgi:uncharacterized membrane protein